MTSMDNAQDDGTQRATSRLVPAEARDLPMVHGWLLEAISTSPFYNAEFKAFEMKRLTLDYLFALHEFDPAHILIQTSPEGDKAGFMISGPELGTLWLFWSYLLPQYRRSRMGINGLRDFADYWDNKQFHKIATYTKPGNDVAEALMKRYGFEHICTLKSHIFGEDYLLYEKPLNKAIAGYDHGLPGEGRFKRLKRRLQHRLGLYR